MSEFPNDPENEASLVERLTAVFLRQLRRGFQPSAVATTPELVELAAIFGFSDPSPSVRAAALSHAVAAAIAVLPEADRKAAAALFGLEDGSSHALGLRRERAATLQGMGEAGFRRHRQHDLVAAVVRELIPAIRDTSANSQGLLSRQAGSEGDARDNQRNDRAILLIGGQTQAVRAGLSAFLRALGLVPFEWEEAARAVGVGTPNVVTVLRGTLDLVQAVVVILEADRERELRSNIAFEAGLAVGVAPERTILVSAGELDLPSGLSATPVVRLGNSALNRTALRSRLAMAGCAVTAGVEAWLDPRAAGDLDVTSEADVTIGDECGLDRNLAALRLDKRDLQFVKRLPAYQREALGQIGAHALDRPSTGSRTQAAFRQLCAASLRNDGKAIRSQLAFVLEAEWFLSRALARAWSDLYGGRWVECVYAELREAGTEIDTSLPAHTDSWTLGEWIRCARASANVNQQVKLRFDAVLGSEWPTDARALLEVRNAVAHGRLRRIADYSDFAGDWGDMLKKIGDAASLTARCEAIL